jgi:hypothetical protein
MSPEDIDQEKSIRDQIMELKRIQREEQEKSRAALREQIGQMMRSQKEAEHARNIELNRLINDILKEKEGEASCGKKSIRAQIAEKMLNAQEEHIRKHHSIDRSRRLEFFQDQGEVDVRKGFLKLHILHVLSQGPSHGYELIHRIGEHTGNTLVDLIHQLFHALPWDRQGGAYN